MELPTKCLLTALLWVLWCTLHSFLIATTVTEYVKKKLGNQFRFYRLFYNTLSLVTLIPLVYCSISIEQAPLFRWEGNLVIVRYFLLATSISLVFAAGRHYSMSELFGIRQIKTGRMNRTLSEYNRLDTSGILGAIRQENVSMFIPYKWFKAKIAGRSRIGSFRKFKDRPPSIPVVNLH